MNKEIKEQYQKDFESLQNDIAVTKFQMEQAENREVNVLDFDGDLDKEEEIELYKQRISELNHELDFELDFNVSETVVGKLNRYISPQDMSDYIDRSSSQSVKTSRKEKVKNYKKHIREQNILKNKILNENTQEEYRKRNCLSKFFLNYDEDRACLVMQELMKAAIDGHKMFKKKSKFNFEVLISLVRILSSHPQKLQNLKVLMMLLLKETQEEMKPIFDVLCKIFLEFHEKEVLSLDISLSKVVPVKDGETTLGMLLKEYKILPSDYDLLAKPNIKIILKSYFVLGGDLKLFLEMLKKIKVLFNPFSNKVKELRKNDIVYEELSAKNILTNPVFARAYILRVITVNDLFPFIEELDRVVDISPHLEKCLINGHNKLIYNIAKDGLGLGGAYLKCLYECGYNSSENDNNFKLDGPKARKFLYDSISHLKFVSLFEAKKRMITNGNYMEADELIQKIEYVKQLITEGCQCMKNIFNILLHRRDFSTEKKRKKKEEIHLKEDIEKELYSVDEIVKIADLIDDYRGIVTKGVKDYNIMPYYGNILFFELILFVIHWFNLPMFMQQSAELINQIMNSHIRNGCHFGGWPVKNPHRLHVFGSDGEFALTNRKIECLFHALSGFFLKKKYNFL